MKTEILARCKQAFYGTQMPEKKQFAILHYPALKTEARKPRKYPKQTGLSRTISSLDLAYFTG